MEEDNSDFSSSLRIQQICSRAVFPLKPPPIAAMPLLRESGALLWAAICLQIWITHLFAVCLCQHRHVLTSDQSRTLQVSWYLLGLYWRSEKGGSGLCWSHPCSDPSAQRAICTVHVRALMNTYSTTIGTQIKTHGGGRICSYTASQDAHILTRKTPCSTS